MSTFKYESRYDALICEHEEQTFNKYKNIIRAYKDEFSKHGFELACKLFWCEDYPNGISDSRAPFRPGYQCGLSIEVERDGALVCYDKEEGSSLAIEIGISSIWKRFFQVYLSLIDSSEELEELIKELERMLEIAKSL